MNQSLDTRHKRLAELLSKEKTLQRTEFISTCVGTIVFPNKCKSAPKLSIGETKRGLLEVRKEQKQVYSKEEKGKVSYFGGGGIIIEHIVLNVHV